MTYLSKHKVSSELMDNKSAFAFFVKTQVLSNLEKIGDDNFADCLNGLDVVIEINRDFTSDEMSPLVKQRAQKMKDSGIVEVFIFIKSKDVPVSVEYDYGTKNMDA